jgi:oligopeptidase B
MTPPRAPREPKTFTLHGDVLVDEYAWMRDKDDPRVRAYLEAEDAYADQRFASLADLRERLYKEMLGRIKETDVSVPYLKSGYWYYARTEQGKQYPILARKRGTLDAAEEIVLDLNLLARDHAYFAVDTFAVSDDGTLLAYSIDTTGFREYTLHVKDLRDDRILSEAIPRVSSAAWASDGRTLFYVSDDDAKRPYRLSRHRLGETGDDLLYEEADERFSLQIRRSRSGAFLFLEADSHTASEAWFLDATRPKDAFRRVLPRAVDLEYEVDDGGGFFWIRINDRGRNHRLVRASIDDLRPEAFEEFLPHRPDVMLAGIDAFAGTLIAVERAGGLDRFVVHDLPTATSHTISFPEAAYSAFPDINAEFEIRSFRFRYQSMVTPPSVFAYDLKTRERTLLKRQEVLGGFDPDRYRVERLAATAPDGAQVAISVAYRRDVRRDGTAPLHLVGYGSYGHPLPVMFSSNRLSLLDRGVVCALAHVRGGGELGKPWHDAGRMANKENSFADLIASADHLVHEGYAARDRIVLEGGSAGGLLVGAALNLRPDVARGAILRVPFVDVLNTMLDTSLPLTVGEFEEWGNPTLPEDYRRMRGYCPYTNLARRPYPALLVKTSLNDSQVMYWEAAKYMARLRAFNDGAPESILKVNFAAGHGGSSGRYDALREVAWDMAWLLHTLRVEG